MNYSVLMSVYEKEKPEYLKEAMESMWNQTMPTDDLVWARTGKGMYHRRGGRKYFQSQKALFKYMRREHMIDSFGYLRSVSCRFINALMPSEWKECIYKRFLRER